MWRDAPRAGLLAAADGQSVRPPLNLYSRIHMAQHRSRDLQRTYSRAQFVAKLRRLADSLEAEAPFTIQVAGERLRLPADVAFNIEHERAGGVDEVEFQLRWRAGR